MVKNTSRLPSLDPLEEAQIFNIGSQSAWQQAFPPPKLLGRCIWLAIFDWLQLHPRSSASSSTEILGLSFLPPMEGGAFSLVQSPTRRKWRHERTTSGQWAFES
jgi:hypothetical protein